MGAQHWAVLTPSRITCHPKGCAATKECACPVQHMKAPEQAQKGTSPLQINVASKYPVGDTFVVTLIRTDTTLDQSRKAEKAVWGRQQVFFRRQRAMLVCLQGLRKWTMVSYARPHQMFVRLLLAEARELTASNEIMRWMTPSEALRRYRPQSAVQCSTL